MFVKHSVYVPTLLTAEQCCSDVYADESIGTKYFQLTGSACMMDLTAVKAQNK
jgi:hypothetical protein